MQWQSISETWPMSMKVTKVRVAATEGVSFSCMQIIIFFFFGIKKDCDVTFLLNAQAKSGELRLVTSPLSKLLIKEH